MVALRAEDLTNLEQVVALAAVERGDNGVIVDEEGIVTALAFDDQAPIQAGIVVDALDFAAVLVVDNHILVFIQVTVQQGDIGRTIGGFIRQERCGAQQEDIVSRERIAR